MPLNDLERAELNAYREKAQRECDEHYQRMRGAMNYVAPMTIAEMQKAMNVNLHAREIDQEYIESMIQETPSGSDYLKAIWYSILIIGAIATALHVIWAVIQ